MFLLRDLPLLILISLPAVTVLAGPQVTITNGILEGSILRTRKGRDIFAFRGIPYAQPPVGQLRFQPPQPPASWKGVRSAVLDGNICLQKADLTPRMTTIGSEDCLYINVYSSILPDCMFRHSLQSQAVMVWFHGGSWMTGSGNSTLYGPQYLLDHDIILVTMNYRLGPLGFLSTADNIIPGNYALKDHVLALQWVQQNIAAFGGDPKRVTIMGESAGAASVHHLMLTKLAEGLFHQAIAQSGSAIGPASIRTAQQTRAVAHRLGTSLNCPTDTSERLLQCLITKDAAEITARPGEWRLLDFLLIPFRPVVEQPHPGAFLTDEPQTLLRHRRSKLVPWMTGLTADEGSGVATFLYSGLSELNAESLNNNFLELFPMIFGYATDCPKSSRDATSQQIRRHYFGDKKIDNTTAMNVVNMATDGLAVIGTATGVIDSLHVRSSIYLYSFQYDGDVKKESLRRSGAPNYGVGHAEDLLYLFPLHNIMLPNSVMSVKDFEMVDKMTAWWTNFARFGKPVPDRSAEVTEMWEPVKSHSLGTYVIKSPTALRMVKDLYRDVLNLWSNLPCYAGRSGSN